MLASYHFVSVIFLLVAAYLASLWLVRASQITMLSHRRVWNCLLLGSFMLSGLIGVVLTFLIEYKFSISWYREFLWLHVEAGLAMAIIAIFHIFWHWRYFWPRRK